MDPTIGAHGQGAGNDVSHRRRARSDSDDLPTERFFQLQRGFDGVLVVGAHAELGAGHDPAIAAIDPHCVHVGDLFDEHRDRERSSTWHCVSGSP